MRSSSAHQLIFSIFRQSVRWIVYLIVLSVITATATRYSFEIFGEEIGGLAFNDLARSLVAGRVGVDPILALNEGFFNGRETVLYFGPLPAIIRIPLVILGDPLLLVSRLACIVASLLAILAVYAICSTMRAKTSSARHGQCGLARIVTVTFAIGSPLLIIVAWPSMFNEAMLWGLATSLWAYHALARIIIARELTPRVLLQLSLCSGLALFSRVTFAVPLYLAIAGLCVVYWRHLWHSPLRLRLLLSLMIPTACIAAAQAWYNVARYGNALRFAPLGDASYLQVSSFGGQWNLMRVPSNVLTYLGLRFSQFSEHFPYIRPVPAHYSPDRVFIQPSWWREDVATFPVVTPLLTIFTMIAVYRIVRSRSALAIGGLILLSLQPFLILTYYAACPRYSAEFMPLLVYCAAYIVRYGTGSIPLWLVKALSLISIVAAITMSYAWNAKWRFNRTQDGIAALLWLPKPTVVCPFEPRVVEFLQRKRVLESPDYINCEIAPMGTGLPNMNPAS